MNWFLIWCDLSFTTRNQRIINSGTDLNAFIGQELSVKLEKIEICDLWSYAGPNKTIIGTLGQVNVVIGRNNVGKSNLMRAIRWVKEDLKVEVGSWSSYKPQKHAVYIPGKLPRDTSPSLRLTFSLESSDWDGRKNCDTLARMRKKDPDCLACKIEVGFEATDGGRGAFVDALPTNSLEFGKCCDDVGFDQVAAKNSLREDGLGFIRERLVLLDGWRRLSDPIEDAPNFFEYLHRLQGSTDDPQSAFICFERIQKFFCELTGLKNAQINVRSDKRGFNVAVNGRNMALSNYGDGISHLFMIASKAAVYNRSVILIEEPETHLHPDLQRHLLRFLTETLSSQIILTTHSPVLLDNSCVDTVIRVDHSGEGSFLRPVETTKSVYAVLDDIGARASDILQANVVIWVEGPSDRIFVKRCLAVVANEFVEGLHFQIVCYGGALRAHFTFDEQFDSLINIMRLSRNTVMICDSDKNGPDDSPNETKERLRKECSAVGGLYWITEGREMENYLTDEVLTRSYRRLLGNEQFEIHIGQFDRLSENLKNVIGAQTDGQKWKVDYDSHKPLLMKYFMDNVFSRKELSRYDLMDRIGEIRDFVARANNYPALRQ